MATRKEYRVGGRDDFIIDYVPQTNGTIELHVPLHPHDPYQLGVGETHLYPSGKVCVSRGREPRSLAAAEKIGKAWAESYANYCRTGRFE